MWATARRRTPGPPIRFARVEAHDVRVLGIDLGRRRIGLAVSDASGTLARPYRTVAATGSAGQAVRAVLPVVHELAADDDGLGLIVVGLPTLLDGGDGPMTAPTRKFARALGAAAGLPVVLQDERLSSHEAEARLAETDADWRRRKRRLDAAAAAVILQDHLDQQPADAGTAEGRRP